MPNIPIHKMIETFPFLDDRTAQEPYLYEVLLDIRNSQNAFRLGKSQELATRESIKKSRTIKMPFTPARNKNIDYLVDLLLERYGEQFSIAITFKMGFDRKEKKLSFKEVEEFALAMKPAEFNEIEKNRVEQSLQNFLILLSNFRIFNLSKIMNKAKHKEEFQQVLKKGEDKSFFTFKSFESDKNQYISAQELCFHGENYEAVKNSLNITAIKAIIANYPEMVKTRLKNYGIMNPDFSDFRDTKVDYLIHILEDEIGTTMASKDLAEVKSFKSLRECIMRVDKMLDPSRIYGNEIVKFIREHKFCFDSDVTSGLLNVNDEILKNWAKVETLKKKNIVKYTDPTGRDFYIDGRSMFNQFNETYQLVRYKNDEFSALTSFQKQSVENKIEVLYHAGLQVVHDEDGDKYLHCNKDFIQNFKDVLEEYSEYMKQKQLRSELTQEKKRGRKRRFSIGGIFIAIIKSIFGIFTGGRDDDEYYESSVGSTSSGGGTSKSGNRPVSREARTIYTKAKNTNRPLLALSDFIELNRENDSMIDKIIQDLRDNNMKIVMPVYNAKKNLYPKRSMKVIMADIEYLLIPIEAARTPESITSYVDSLVGYKMKDDIISGHMLIQIEKYLRTINRQNRRKLMRND